MTSSYWAPIALAVMIAGGCTKDEPAAPVKPAADAKVAAPETKAAPVPTEENTGARTWTFEDASVGAVPSGVRPTETGGVGTPAIWAVAVREDAPSPPHVFGVTRTENIDHTYNVALWEDTSVADVDLQVMVHAVEGVKDQGGGLIWRAKDANNYYIARWNPVEKNVRFYVVLDGHRSTLGKAEIDLDPERWHELRVVAQGERMQCFVDDEPVLQIEDASLKDAGAIGLWTKGDAATLFDDLSLAAP